MSTAPESLPALQPVSESEMQSAGLPSLMKMSPGLAIFFNDALYQRCKQIAMLMSQAGSMMPKHLANAPQACFAILSRAITWNLDPMAVGMSTYQTPNGSVGYEGKLIQAILENSGQFEGGIKFTLYGDWSKVKGKFKIIESTKGGKYPSPTWTREDATGLGVTVTGQVKGESEPRSLDFDLDTAFPLNSPLWATAPDRQIKYTAVRAFANQVTPGILMGIPFDVDPTGFYDGTPMTDVTPPRPTSSMFERQPGATAEAAHPGETSGTGEAKGEGSQEPAGEAQESDQRETVTTEPEVTELPFARGIRLLPLCKSITDVADLRQSVAEELDDEEQKAGWDALCTAKTKRLERELAAASAPKKQTAKK